LFTDNKGIIVEKTPCKITILLKSGGTITTEIETGNLNLEIGDKLYYTVNYCNNPPTINYVKRLENY
jgi:hypothetical protein